ncbi:hypothetical protein [uncultured Desulfovibrio sp.]|nr:hypothetical protein [uncultured Desulfovibrio sp.]
MNLKPLLTKRLFLLTGCADRKATPAATGSAAPGPCGPHGVAFRLFAFR